MTYNQACPGPLSDKVQPYWVQVTRYVARDGLPNRDELAFMSWFFDEFEDSKLQELISANADHVGGFYLDGGRCRFRNFEGFIRIPGDWPEPKSGDIWLHVVPYYPNPEPCNPGLPVEAKSQYVYVVGADDTPWGVARKFGEPAKSWIKLRGANLEDNFETQSKDVSVCTWKQWGPGKRLKIPLAWNDPPQGSKVWQNIEVVSSGSIAGPPTRRGEMMHTHIVGNETPRMIAEKYGIDLEDLFAVNPHLRVVQDDRTGWKTWHPKDFRVGMGVFIPITRRVQPSIGGPWRAQDPDYVPGPWRAQDPDYVPGPWRAQDPDYVPSTIGYSQQPVLRGPNGLHDPTAWGPQQPVLRGPNGLHDPTAWGPQQPVLRGPNGLHSLGGYDPFPENGQIGECSDNACQCRCGGSCAVTPQPPGWGGHVGAAGDKCDCGSVTPREDVRYIVGDEYPGAVAVKFGRDSSDHGQIRAANFDWPMGCWRNNQNVCVLKGWKPGIKIKLPLDWFGPGEEFWSPAVYNQLYFRDAAGQWTIPYVRGSLPVTGGQCPPGTVPHPTIQGLCVPGTTVPGGGTPGGGGTGPISGQCPVDAPTGSQWVPGVGCVTPSGIPAVGGRCPPGLTLAGNVCMLPGTVPGTVPGGVPGVTPVGVRETKEEGWPMWAWALLGAGAVGVGALAYQKLGKPTRKRRKPRKTTRKSKKPRR